MNLFNGFSHMSQYFSKIHEPDQSHLFADERKKLDDYKDSINNEKEIIVDMKKQMLKKVKTKGAELLNTIIDTKKDVELETTKKIQCNGHHHTSLKTYKECSKKIYKDIDTSADFAYFFSTYDPTFDLMIASLFNMFPEISDQSCLDKILKIKQLVLEKEEMYNKLINNTDTELINKNITDESSENDDNSDLEDDNESDNSNSDDNESDNSGDDNDSEGSDDNNTDEKSPEEELQNLKDNLDTLNFNLKKATKFTIISKIKKEIAEKEIEIKELKKSMKK